MNPKDCVEVGKAVVSQNDHSVTYSNGSTFSKHSSLMNPEINESLRHRFPSEVGVDAINAIRVSATKLMNDLDSLKQSYIGTDSARHIAIAVTHLEESVIWACKGIAFANEKENPETEPENS